MHFETSVFRSTSSAFRVVYTNKQHHVGCMRCWTIKTSFKMSLFLVSKRQDDHMNKKLPGKASETHCSHSQEHNMSAHVMLWIEGRRETVRQRETKRKSRKGSARRSKMYFQHKGKCWVRFTFTVLTVQVLFLKLTREWSQH